MPTLNQYEISASMRFATFIWNSVAHRLLQASTSQQHVLRIDRKDGLRTDKSISKNRPVIRISWRSINLVMVCKPTIQKGKICTDGQSNLTNPSGVICICAVSEALLLYACAIF